MQKKLSGSKQMLLVIAVVVVFMAGLAVVVSTRRSSPPAAASEPTPDVQFVPEATSSPAPSVFPTEAVTPNPTDVPPFDVPGMEAMTNVQRNSIHMLNYLTMVAEDVSGGKNSILFLQMYYAGLYENILPTYIDSMTRDSIQQITGAIKELEIAVDQLERIQYTYEQHQVLALWELVPDAEDIHNLVKAMTGEDLDGSIFATRVAAIATIASSVAQCQQANINADITFVLDAGELSDGQKEILHSLSSTINAYSINIVHEYGLADQYALSPADVREFLDKKHSAAEHLHAVTDWLVTKQDTYRHFGPYWLTLAECCYKTGDYSNCLRALNTYEALEIGFFRYDYTFASVLPLGIAAASQVLDEASYIETALHYLDLMPLLAPQTNWMLRYHASQTYLDLYTRTGDAQYLQEAYALARYNVTTMVAQQRKLNAEYLANEEKVADAGATKAQKEDIKRQNAARQLQLPPVHEPLLLNCDMLLMLADALELSDAERLHMDNILFENGMPLFLVSPLNARCHLLPQSSGESIATSTDIGAQTSDASRIRFNDTHKEIEIPAHLVSDTAIIRVTVTCGEDTQVFEDWSVKSVSRGEAGNINTFTVTYASPSLAEFNYSIDSSITIEVTSHRSCSTSVAVCEYITVKAFKLFHPSYCVPQRVE